jgi:FkbM family methyltransferase
LVSDVISNRGRWAECDGLSTLFSSFARRSDELIVDIGANIGACTLSLLLDTEARVIAFEPGPDNLFYLTSSLLALREMLPEVAQRARLYPLAMGDARRVEVLHGARGNAGHSVIGSVQASDKFAEGGFEGAQQIQVGTLDEVLWPRAQRNDTLYYPPSVAMLKLDVEGYECNALRGMRALLCARAVRSLKVEVFDHALRQQGCSGLALQQMLVEAGFLLYLEPPEPAGLRRPQAQQQPQPFDAGTLYNNENYNVYAVLENELRRPHLRRRHGLRRCRQL